MSKIYIPSNEVKIGKEPRDKVLQGINEVCDIVEITLGPKGRNVLLDRGPTLMPIITNDGVSIAREIVFKDRYKDMGASIAKSIAEAVNDEAGDATTTSLVLTKAIVNSGVKQIEESGDIATKESLEKATENVLKQLDKMSRKIESDEDIVKIATYTSENKEIGKLIAETIKDIGVDGVITVEESLTGENYVEKIDGMSIDTGYIHPVFKTTGTSAEYNNVPVLITDQTISTKSQIEPLLSKLLQGGQKSLVIIAEDFDGGILNAIALNNAQGGVRVLPIKAPSIGDNMFSILDDIAVLTNGTFVSKNSGYKLEQVNPTALGFIEKIKAKKNETIIVSSHNKEGVEAKIETIKEQIKDAQSEFDKKKAKERIAKLSGGVAVLRISSISEANNRYLKDKIEDAVNSTRYAIEEGIIIGGGLALKDCKLDDTIGGKILAEALKRPYELLSKDISDSELEKVIDPVKAIKSAVKHSSSAIGTFLTTGGTIISVREDNGE